MNSEEVLKFKVFFPKELFVPERRGEMFSIIKAHTRKFKDKELALLDKIEWVEHLESAHVVFIPMSLQYYWGKNKGSEVIRFIEKCNNINIPVWAFSSGDIAMSLPADLKLQLYKFGGYRSKYGVTDRQSPVELSDPIDKKGENQIIDIAFPKSDKPIIGFCGMAPRGKKVSEMMKVLAGNMKRSFEKTPWDRQEVISSSHVRRQTLDILMSSKEVLSNFLIRDRYRNGVTNKKGKMKAAIEYFDNMRASQYVLCIRGAGNFSVRFYETLAMGRIPVFVDLDSPLPLLNGLNWNDHLVLCSRNQLSQLPELILEWEKNNDPEIASHKNRKLWVERLDAANFWLHELMELSN